MKNKFWYLVKNTLATKFFTKAFLFANIFIFLILLVLTNIPNIINATVPDEEFDSTVYVVNETSGDIFNHSNSKIIFDAIKENNEAFDNLTLDFQELESLDDEDAYIEKVNDNEDLIIIFSEVDNEILLTYYSYDPLSINLDGVVSTIYQSLYFSHIGHQPPSLENIIGNTQSDQLSEEKSTALRSIFPMLLGMPIFFLILMAVQFTGTEIVEEKSSKMIEIVLTNIKAGYHLLAKITAVTVGVAAQLFMTLILGGIATYIAGLISNLIPSNSATSGTEETDLMGLVEFFFGDSMDRLILALIFTMIYIVIGVLSYSILSGILASTASSIQDFNKVITPLTMFIMIGYFINIIASTMGEKASVVMMFASYIPLVSFQIAPAAYLLGDISLLGIIISIIINIIFVVFTLKIAFNIYKEALLNFSEGSPFKILFSSFKRQKQNKK